MLVPIRISSWLFQSRRLNSVLPAVEFVLPATEIALPATEIVLPAIDMAFLLTLLQAGIGRHCVVSNFDAVVQRPHTRHRDI
jgi:hypothetical protein